VNEDTGLVMLVPSRGRPQNVVDLMDACMDITTVDTQLAVIVDDDDPLLQNYHGLLKGNQFAELVVVPKQRIGPPAKICQILNWYAPLFAARHPYVGFMGDDHRPRTKGWDEELTLALDRPGVAYGNDLFQQQNLPTACVISSELVLALGYMCPPPCHHLFLDDFWKLLGATAGNLAYLPDVVVEHCHPGAGKAEWDAGYTYSMSIETMDGDRQRYNQFLSTDWPVDKQRVEALRG
jgi:hypothetical protein